MTSRAPEFVRERIEWRAKKHGLPFKNTALWSEAPPALQHALPTSFASPVVFSMSDGGEATIIGTHEILVSSKQGNIRVQLAEIESVTSPCPRQGKQKLDCEALELVVAGGSRHHIPTEKGEACFAFWNILLMLARTNRKGEQDGAPRRRDRR